MTRLTAALLPIAGIVALLASAAAAPPPTTTLVSVNSAGTGSGNGMVSPSELSPSGRFVLMGGNASDLTTTLDGNGLDDIFVRDLRKGTSTLVSVNSAGTAAGDDASGPFGRMTPNGRFVAFGSLATDLVTTPVGGSEVFLRDLKEGATTLVSVNAAGTAGGNGSSFVGAVSKNGRFVAFTSAATDLASLPDGNGAFDVFVRDVKKGRTALVSVNSAGTAAGVGAGGSSVSWMSADGRRVVFVSSASDLVSNDANGTIDIFVRDLKAAVTTLVTVNASGTGSADGYSDLAVVNRTGRYVAIQSAATDLTAVPEGNSSEDVFVRDLETGVTTLASINAAGTASGNALSYQPRISANGHFVGFSSYATDLVAIPVGGILDAYVRDLEAGTTTLVSINSSGTAGGNAPSVLHAISANGRFVAFSSSATDLVATPVSGNGDAYVRDLKTGETLLLSVNGTATAGGDASSYGPALSRSGRRAIFSSIASDLTGLLDANGVSDVFVRPVR